MVRKAWLKSCNASMASPIVGIVAENQLLLGLESRQKRVNLPINRDPGSSWREVAITGDKTMEISGSEKYYE
jgi:hypothetical protein